MQLSSTPCYYIPSKVCLLELNTVGALLILVQVQIQVTLQPTVSRTVRLGVPFGAHNQILNLF
jgi:hypothetical protein